jgi:serine/threonine protein kinase
MNAPSDSYPVPLVTGGVPVATVATPPEADGSTTTSPSEAVRFEQVCDAYQEFARLQKAGAAPDPDKFCDRYPLLRTSLARLINCHAFLEDNPELLEGAPPWPRAGDTFQGFHLERELGRGAFARVFKARELALGGRTVALKVSRAGGGEAWTQGRLDHPHVMPVHSVRLSDTGLTVVCMPYHGSATLEALLDLVRSAPELPRHAAVISRAARVGDPDAPPAAPVRGSYVDGVRRLGAQIADALRCLHAKQVFHRDLKPSNVLLGPDSGAMLLDFNLARDALTDESRLGGTLPYMAPEHLRATDPAERSAAPSLVDARSDLYSLGVLLYELLTGRHPFGPLSAGWSAEEARQALRERQQQPLTAVRQLNPCVDAPLAALVERCLAADPAERPQTAAEVAVALGRRAVRPRLWRWAVPAALVLAAVVWQATPAAPPSPLEEGQRAYRERRYEDAVGHFREVLKSKPADADAWFALGRAYQQWGESDDAKYAQALDAYQRATDLHPAGATDACMGYCLYRTRQSALGMYRFQQAEEKGYQSAAFANDLGYMHLADAHPDKALPHLDKALKDNRRLQAAYHNKAYAFYMMVMSKGGHRPPRTETPAKKLAADTNREWLREAGTNIAAALDCGSAPSELLVDAALVYAARASFDVADADQALAYLQKAADQGLDPAYFANNILLNNTFCWQGWSVAGMDRMKRYHDIRALSGHGHKPGPTVRLLDPVRD